MKHFIVFDPDTLSPLGMYLSEFLISDAIISDGKDLIHAELQSGVDPHACRPEKISGVWYAVAA